MLRIKKYKKVEKKYRKVVNMRKSNHKENFFGNFSGKQTKNIPDINRKNAKNMAEKKTSSIILLLNT